MEKRGETKSNEWERIVEMNKGHKKGYVRCCKLDAE